MIHLDFFPDIWNWNFTSYFLIEILWDNLLQTLNAF